MGPKKGLSLEQKRERVLEIFHENDDVFQLKEIEKEASKRGVVFQSVKEVVQSLVDDDLIHQDKIGISNFLWSFVAEASSKVKHDEELAQRALEAAKKESENVTAELTMERDKCTDFAERKVVQDKISSLSAKIERLKEEKSALSIIDPERFEAMKEAAKICRDSANRWLDNMHALKEWCGKKFSGRDKELDEFFAQHGMNEKLDYLT